MKKFLLFFLSLFTCLVTSAQSTLPDFSTEKDPVWFSVKFKEGGAYLSDQGSGKNMKTVADAGSSKEKFQFIGKQGDFKMKSKAGTWVSFANGRFTTTSTASKAAQLAIINGTADGYFEIKQKSNAGNSMNQWGGAGANKELGEWGNGDTNNQLSFVLQTAVLPVFSTADGTVEQYYFVRFLCDNNCMGTSTNGKDNCVRIYPADPLDGQQWKLVGTKDNFQLLSKSGVYASISNEGIDTEEGGHNGSPLRYSDKPEAKGFKLVETEKTSNGVGFEIVSNGRSGNNTLNHWGSTSGQNTIGLWKTNDPNNVVSFVLPEKMTYADYKSTGIEGYVPEHDLTLWYTQPATTARTFGGSRGYNTWMEYGLPIGDGQLGASLFGGIEKDQILFNEKTVWTGTSTSYKNEYQFEVFGSLYAQNLGEDFNYSSEGAAKNYYRQLDLTNATGKVSFQNQKGVTYTREYIASNPAGVIVARYTADKAGQINLLFTMKAGNVGVKAETAYADGEGHFSGKLQTVSYDARFKVVNVGGTIKTTAEGVEVRNADEVLVYLAGGSDFDAYASTFVKNTAALKGQMQARVNDASKQTWAELYAAHVADFQKYFARVNFDLEGTKNEVPTNELIDAYNGGNGKQALMLEKLYFAYGRYLEISSSRGVDLPSNLQGIWNGVDYPAWNSDIHSNINVQMNYWPAEPTNLSEMHVPFLHYIWNMAENHPQWKQYAKESGQNRGWTCYTENNIFGGVGGFAHNYVIANAWYATHLWQHYRYTLDKAYLKKVFPAMLSASQFWMDRLKKDKDGLYVAPREYSPEHGPGAEDGVAHAQQLVYDLFSNTLAAIDVLGADAKVSEADLKKLQERFNKLDNGLRTETYDGAWGTGAIAKGTKILREWKYSPYNVQGAENGHRHMSHLMCLYPFSQIHPGTGLFDAAVNSMKLRGDGATGWSMGWKINLWARALDGNHARKILNNALRHANHSSGVYYNLFDAHDPFQIDGNFGACAGIAEMVMQSNADTIRVLPALPTAWKAGHMSGLKAVKDFTVDVTWAKNKATRIVIKNNQGQKIPVLYKGLDKAVVYVNGEEKKDLAIDAKGVAMLEGEAGTTYEFVFDGTPTGLNEADVQAVKVNVKGNNVVVSGKDVKTVRVFDLQGRLVKVSSKSIFALNNAAHSALLVEVTDVDGNVTTEKVVM